MIEDKFGASSLGRLPPLQAAPAASAFALPPRSPLLLPPPPPRRGRFVCVVGGDGGCSGPDPFQGTGCKSGCPRLGPPLRLPTLPLSPPQPMAPLRCSVPAPSWSPPHLPMPTGRSTGGKRAPGPPDQMAPAVLLKVRGTLGSGPPPDPGHLSRHSALWPVQLWNPGQVPFLDCAFPPGEGRATYPTYEESRSVSSPNGAFQRRACMDPCSLPLPLTVPFL